MPGKGEKMKKIMYCLLFALLFTFGKQTEAATLQNNEIIQFQDGFNQENYQPFNLEYPEKAKGWKAGVYYRRQPKKSYGDKYFRIEQGNLVVQSQMWQEPARIGKPIPYHNTGGMMWDAENADYEVEVTFENPTKEAYRVYVKGNDMIQTGYETISPNQSQTVKFTVSVVYGKLELLFIVPQSVAAVEQSVWKEAYISQIKIQKKERESKGRIPTIFIAGDSTAATMDGSYSPREGWGQELHRYIRHHGKTKVTKREEPGYEVGWYEYRMNSAVIENRATSGESTNSFRDTGKFDSILNKIKPGDFVLVQFSSNDCRDNVPYKNTSVSKFKQNLRYFADGVKQRGGKCIFLSSVPRWRYTKGEKILSVALPYRRTMQKTAAECGIPFVDIGKITDEFFTVLGKEASREFYMVLPKKTYSNYPAGLTDISHFRIQGARKVAQIVASELQKRNIGGLSSLIKVEKNYYKGLSRTVPVKSVKKKNSKKTVLKWKNVKYANRYTVLKYNKKSKHYVKMGTTKKNSYVLKTGKRSGKYMVRVEF